MEPYQKASQSLRERGEAPIHAVKNLGYSALGGGAASLGSSVVSKLIPKVGSLINKYVPDNLSQAGLSKLDPRFGKFIQGALDEGYSYDDVRSTIEEKLGNTVSQQAKNLIEQESPELHQFLDQEIKKGRKPIEAGAIAQNNKKFTNTIKKLMKTHKTSWSNIIESVFGGQGTAQPEEQQPSQQGMQQTQQGGQGIDPGVAQIMQQGNEIIKRFRGQ
jgi:hypothetical protein